MSKIDKEFIEAKFSEYLKPDVKVNKGIITCGRIKVPDEMLTLSMEEANFILQYAVKLSEILKEIYK